LVAYDGNKPNREANDHCDPEREPKNTPIPMKTSISEPHHEPSTDDSETGVIAGQGDASSGLKIWGLIGWSNLDSPSQKRASNGKPDMSGQNPGESNNLTIAAPETASFWRIQFPKPPIPKSWEPMISDVAKGILDDESFQEFTVLFMQELIKHGAPQWTPKPWRPAKGEKSCRVELPIQTKQDLIAEVRKIRDVTDDETESIVLEAALQKIRVEFAVSAWRTAEERMAQLRAALEKLDQPEVKS